MSALGHDRAATSTTLLRTTDLNRSFGTITAVAEVYLKVAEGARHAVVGPRGAGKSTLVKLIAGTMKVDAGVVEFAGRDVTGMSAVRRGRLGMSQAEQYPGPLPSRTALETVTMAVQRQAKGRIALLRRQEPAVRERAERLLTDVGLIRSRDTPARALSAGERKQLEVALALARRPRLLLLDEPAAGMSPAARARFVELVEGLPAEVTVLLVDHDLDLVSALADVVTVLHLGRVLMTGPPARIRASEAVKQAYLGVERIRRD